MCRRSCCHRRGSEPSTPPSSADAHAAASPKHARGFQHEVPEGCLLGVLCHKAVLPLLSLQYNRKTTAEGVRHAGGRRCDAEREGRPRPHHTASCRAAGTPRQLPAASPCARSLCCRPTCLLQQLHGDGPRAVAPTDVAGCRTQKGAAQGALEGQWQAKWLHSTERGSAGGPRRVRALAATRRTSCAAASLQPAAASLGRI